MQQWIIQLPRLSVCETTAKIVSNCYAHLKDNAAVCKCLWRNRSWSYFIDVYSAPPWNVARRAPATYLINRVVFCHYKHRKHEVLPSYDGHDSWIQYVSSCFSYGYSMSQPYHLPRSTLYIDSKILRGYYSTKKYPKSHSQGYIICPTNFLP